MTARRRPSSARIASSSAICSRSFSSSLLDVDPGQAGQLAEAHLEDVLGLELGELERRAMRPPRAAAAVLAGADQGDHLVDHVEGPEQALQDVLVAGGPCPGGTATGG